MSRASRRLSPAVGNQCQYCSEARKPISRMPASMVGTDHRASMTPPETTSKLPPRSRAARTPDADRHHVDEGQGEQVEQQGDRDALGDEVEHRAPEAEAGAQVRALEEREAGEAVVLVEGEAGRRDVVEPAQVLHRRGLVEAVEAVVVVLQRLLRLRLQVLALDQVLGADAPRRRRHHHEDHQGDPDQGREHQEDAPDEVGDHATADGGWDDGRDDIGRMRRTR